MQFIEPRGDFFGLCVLRESAGKILIFLFMHLLAIGNISELNAPSVCPLTPCFADAGDLRPLFQRSLPESLGLTSKPTIQPLHRRPAATPHRADVPYQLRGQCALSNPGVVDLWPPSMAVHARCPCRQRTQAAVYRAPCRPPTAAAGPGHLPRCSPRPTP